MSFIKLNELVQQPQPIPSKENNLLRPKKPFREILLN